MPKSNTPKEAPVMFDKAGRQIQPGDLIVYGHALGRCAALRYGIAIAVQWSKAEWVEPKPHLSVVGVDESGRWNSDKREYEAALCKRGTLQFGDRILKVTEDQMPPEFLALLKTVNAKEL